MKDHITPQSIANTIRMMRPAFKGAIMVVEGDSDARLYGKFIDNDACRIVPSFGKSNALIALGMLGSEGLDGIIFILDSDFWRLDDSERTSPSLFLTDAHDLETMILSSRALDTILSEFGSSRKLKRIRGGVTNLLLSVSLPLGYLRWISSSKQDNLSLRFKDGSFDTCIVVSDGSMRMDVNAMITEVRRASGHVTFNSTEIQKRVTTLVRSRSHDPWQVCRGHDMVRVLTVGLHRVFGNRTARNVSYEEVDRLLRLAYGFIEFSGTALYKAIRGWERDNPEFSVFLRPG